MNSNSNNYSFSRHARSDASRTFQGGPSPRAHGVPSNGQGYYHGTRANATPVNVSPAYAADSVKTLSINQAVQVFYEGTWVAGFIVAGLHRIEVYNRLGYTVNFLAGRQRYVEGEFLQEHVKVAPPPEQYT